MENNITKSDLQKEWKDISGEAYARAEKTHDQFNKDLVLIGASFTALSALLVYVKPDLTGISIATLFPLTGALAAHIRNYKREHFYKAFASYALDMRDAEIAEGQALKLPRIDHKILKFKQSEIYSSPSTLTCLSHFRSAIIGVAAGTAMTIVGGFSEKGFDLSKYFRKEDGEATQEKVERGAVAGLPQKLPPTPQ